MEKRDEYLTCAQLMIRKESEFASPAALASGVPLRCLDAAASRIASTARLDGWPRLWVRRGSRRIRWPRRWRPWLAGSNAATHGSVGSASAAAAAAGFEEPPYR